MKKTLIFLTLTVLLLLCLTSCEHQHNFGEWSVIENATCTEDGMMVSHCDCNETQNYVIPAIGHNYANDICANCGDVKVSTECKHQNLDVLSAVSPTCTETGLSEGIMCLDCKELIKEQELVSALDHDEYIYTEKDENCNVFNVTVCNRNDCDFSTKINTGIVDHLSGTPVIENTVPPTCYSNGSYEEVVYCSAEKCKCELSRTRKTTPAIEHVYANVITSPTAKEDGYISCVCSNCGDFYIDSKIVPFEFVITSSNRNQIGFTGLTDEKLVIPAVFKSEDVWYRVTSIDDSAFCSCATLVEVVIPESIKKIGKYAFRDCDALVQIDIPSSVESIGEFAFYSCDSLISVTMGDNENLRRIEGSCFAECEKLETVRISTNITSIVFYAFRGCSSLEKIEYSGSVDQWNNISKQEGYPWNSDTGAYTIYCTDGKITKNGIISYK